MEQVRTSDEVMITFGHMWFSDQEPFYFGSIQMTRTNARWLADLLEKQIIEAEGKSNVG